MDTNFPNPNEKRDQRIRRTLKNDYLAVVLFFLFIIVGLAVCNSRGSELLPTMTIEISVPPTETTSPTPTSIALTSKTPTLGGLLLPSATPDLEHAGLTPTATPVLPPAEPLPSEGAYLLYPVADGDGLLKVVTRGKTGRGSKVDSLPAGALTNPLSGSVSPNGEWMYFYLIPEEEKVKEIQICILDLADGSNDCIADLLLPSYPDNLWDIQDDFPDRDISIEDIYDTFVSGIYMSSWSRDSRYLAFVGQLDSPSTDLYVYDIQTGKTIRVSEDPNNISFFSWSTGSQALLYQSRIETGMGDELVDYYFASLNEDKDIWSVELPSNFIFYSWANEETVTYYHYNSGPGHYGLTNLNLRTGVKGVLFGGAIDDFLFDSKYKRLIVSFTYPEEGGLYSTEDTRLPGGTYFYDAETGKADILRDPDVDPDFSNGTPALENIQIWGSPYYRYVGDSTIGGIGSYAITDDGIVYGFARYKYRPVPAPNGNWLILSSQMYDMIFLYDNRAELVKEIKGSGGSFSDVQSIQWRPDSKGIFFTVLKSDRENKSYDLYYMDIPDGEPFLVDHSLLDDILTWR